VYTIFMKIKQKTSNTLTLIESHTVARIIIFIFFIIAPVVLLAFIPWHENIRYLVPIGIFFVVGLFITLFTSTIKVVVDLQGRKVFVYKKHVWSKEKLKTDYDFSEIEHVMIHYINGRDKNDNRTRKYKLALKTRDGGIRRLSTSSSGGMSVNGVKVFDLKLKKLKEVANELATFIGVPFVDLDTPGLSYEPTK